MERIINLNRNYGRFNDNSAFIIDESLVFKFESDYVLAHCIIHISDGKVEKKFERYNVEEFVVPEEFIKAGELYVGVDIVAKGVIVKHIDVEPLAIKEEDAQLNFVPLIYEQNQKIALAEAKVAELQEQLGIKSAQIDALQLDVARLFEIVEQQP